MYHVKNMRCLNGPDRCGATMGLTAPSFTPIVKKRTQNLLSSSSKTPSLRNSSHITGGSTDRMNGMKRPLDQKGRQGTRTVERDINRTTFSDVRICFTKFAHWGLFASQWTPHARVQGKSTATLM